MGAFVKRGNASGGVVDGNTSSVTTDYNQSYYEAKNVKINEIGQIHTRRGLKRCATFKAENYEFVKGGISCTVDNHNENRIFFINGTRIIIDKYGNNISDNKDEVVSGDVDFITMEYADYYDQFGKYLIQRGIAREPDGKGSFILKYAFRFINAALPYNEVKSITIKGLPFLLSAITATSVYQQRLWFASNNQLIASKIGSSPSLFKIGNNQVIVDDSVSNVKRLNDYFDILRCDTRDFVDNANKIQDGGVAGGQAQYKQTQTYGGLISRNQKYDQTYLDTLPIVNVYDKLKMYDIDDPVVKNGTYDKDNSIVFDMFEEVYNCALIKIKNSNPVRYYVRVQYKHGKGFTSSNITYSNTNFDYTKTEDETRQSSGLCTAAINLASRSDGSITDSAADQVPQGVEVFKEKDGLTATMQAYTPDLFDFDSVKFSRMGVYRDIDSKKNIDWMYLAKCKIGSDGSGSRKINRIGSPGEASLAMPELEIYTMDDSKVLNKIDVPLSPPIFRNEYDVTKGADSNFISQVYDNNTEELIESYKFTPRASNISNVNSEDKLLGGFMEHITKSIPLKGDTSYNYVNGGFNSTGHRNYIASTLPANNGIKYATIYTVLTNVTKKPTNKDETDPLLKVYGFGNFLAQKPYPLTDIVDGRKKYQNLGYDNINSTVYSVPVMLAPFLNDFEFISVNDPSVRISKPLFPRDIDYTPPADPTKISVSDRLYFEITDKIMWLVVHKEQYVFTNSSIRFFPNKENNAIVVGNDSLVKICDLETSRTIRPAVLHDTLYFVGANNRTIWKIVGVPDVERYNVELVNDRNREILGELERLSPDIDDRKVVIKDSKGKVFNLNHIQGKNEALSEFQINNTRSADEDNTIPEQEMLTIDKHPIIDTKSQKITDLLGSPYKDKELTGSIPFMKVVDRFERVDIDYEKGISKLRPIYKYVKVTSAEKNISAAQLIGISLGFGDLTITEKEGTPDGRIGNAGRTFTDLEADPKYSVWAEAEKNSIVTTRQNVSALLTPICDKIIKGCSKAGIDLNITADTAAYTFGYNILEGSINGYLDNVHENYNKVIYDTKRAIEQGLNVFTYAETQYSEFTEYKQYIYRFILSIFDMFRIGNARPDNTSTQYLEYAAQDLKKFLQETSNIYNIVMDSIKPLVTKNKIVEAVIFTEDKETDDDIPYKDAINNATVSGKDIGLKDSDSYLYSNSLGTLKYITGSEQDTKHILEDLILSIKHNRIVASDGSKTPLPDTDPLKKFYNKTLDEVVDPYMLSYREDSMEYLKNTLIFNPELDITKIDGIFSSLKYREILSKLLLLSTRTGEYLNTVYLDGSLEKEINAIISDILTLLNIQGQMGENPGESFFNTFKTELYNNDGVHALKYLKNMTDIFTRFINSKVVLYSGIPEYASAVIDTIVKCGDTVFFFILNKKDNSIIMCQQREEGDDRIYQDEVMDTSNIYVKVKTTDFSTEEFGIDVMNETAILTELKISADFDRSFDVRADIVPKDSLLTTKCLYFNKYANKIEQSIRRISLSNTKIGTNNLTLEKTTDGKFVIRDMHVHFQRITT